jgi:pyruvate dehydrogenase E1 component alpha subunit
VKRLVSIPESLGIRARSVDGRDADALGATFGEAVALCRSGAGPAFIETVTRRWEGSKPMWPELSTGLTDIAMAWDEARIPARFGEWYREEDPILVYIRRLLADGRARQEDIVALDRSVSARIDAARRSAIEAPMPQPHTAFDHVFA